MKIDGISFNKEWAKEVSEAQFVAEFQNVEHIYPGTDKDARLKAAYAKLNPKAEEVAVDLKKK